MSRQSLILIVVGLVGGVVVATHLPLRAQGKGKPPADQLSAAPNAEVQPSAVSVQEALLRPYHFKFGRPTSLAEVSQRLGRELGAPVVLDLAALERLDIKPEQTVKLELDGVRLKTGLKLLLDQAGLTYRVVPEDNLLILTDKEGSEDPVERVLAELRELHRDVHDVQDTIEELRENAGLAGAEGARVRKPTIIEEMPEEPGQKPEQAPSLKPSPRPDSGPKPPGNPPPRRRTRL